MTEILAPGYARIAASYASLNLATIRRLSHPGVRKLGRENRPYRNFQTSIGRTPGELDDSSSLSVAASRSIQSPYVRIPCVTMRTCSVGSRLLISPEWG